IVTECREARSEAIFEPHQAFDRDSRKLIMERADRRSGPPDLHTRECAANTESHMCSQRYITPANISLRPSVKSMMSKVLPTRSLGPIGTPSRVPETLATDGLAIRQFHLTARFQ